MQKQYDKDSVIGETNLREFFQDSVSNAVQHQRQNITPETIFYLSNLLTDFTYTENVFDEHSEGNTLKPLVAIYSEAIEAATRQQQNACLKKLGDLSLFISGLFSWSLNRSLVDVDYYVAMGGNAYGYLAQNTRDSMNTRIFSDIFNELSDKFVIAIDILTEVGDRMNNRDNRDIMRLYEIWMRTGSQLAAVRLRREGIDPVATGYSRH